jgi:hypothetical protein
MKLLSMFVFSVVLSSTAWSQSISRLTCVGAGDAGVNQTYDLLNAEVTGLEDGSFRVTGKPVVMQNVLSSEASACRSWYLYDVHHYRRTYWEFTYEQRNRDWNQIVVTTAPQVLDVSCAVGSEVNTYDSLDAFKQDVLAVYVETPAPGSLRSLRGYVSGRWTVGAQECISFDL